MTSAPEPSGHEPPADSDDRLPISDAQLPVLAQSLAQAFASLPPADQQTLREQLLPGLTASHSSPDPDTPGAESGSDYLRILQLLRRALDSPSSS